MSLTAHAHDELKHAGWFGPDSAYGGMMGFTVMRMIEQFAAEGHSGMSANLAIQLFQKLANYEPLTPLTGEDDEWTEVDDGLYQNKRCSHVFKNADGAYDIDGKVFRNPDGSCFTNSDSRVAVTFPYTPTTEYVDVNSPDPGKQEGGISTVTCRKTGKQLKAVLNNDIKWLEEGDSICDAEENLIGTLVAVEEQDDGKSAT